MPSIKRREVIVLLAVVFLVARLAHHLRLQGFLRGRAGRILLQELLVCHGLDRRHLSRAMATQKVIGKVARMIRDGA